MDVAPLADDTNFYAQFTGFVIAWNTAELIARLMLHHVLGGTQTSRAVAADLGNIPLKEALQAAARDTRLSGLRHRIEHFIAGYERILPYRNYYVHSLAFPITDEGAQLLSLAGKGRLRLHSEKLPANQVNEMMNHAMDLAHWGGAILKELGSKLPSLNKYVAYYEASPQNPEWPDPLKKALHYAQPK